LEHVPALDDLAQLAEAADAVPAYSGFPGQIGFQCRIT
jgi:hypothetical protein